MLPFGEAADDDIGTAHVEVMRLFADEIGIRVPQRRELVTEVVGAVDVIVIHFRDDIARGRFDSPIEARSERLVGADLDDLQAVDPEVRSACSQIGRSREPVGDEDEFLVRVQLGGMSGEHLAEVARPIRRDHR